MAIIVPNIIRSSTTIPGEFSYVKDRLIIIEFTNIFYA